VDHARTLNDILLKIGGSNLDEAWGNFVDPRVVEFLADYGKEFSTENLECLKETPFPDWRKPLDPVQCHRNCADLRVYAPNGPSEYRIVYGWALSDNGSWSCHSWCIRRTGPENIIETTRPRVSYFGFVVPDDVHVLATYIVPSTLGEQLEKWQSSATSASATSQR
jgi:hypothetical protein